MTKSFVKGLWQIIKQTIYLIFCIFGSVYGIDPIFWRVKNDAQYALYNWFRQEK